MYTHLVHGARYIYISIYHTHPVDCARYLYLYIYISIYHTHPVDGALVIYIYIIYMYMLYPLSPPPPPPPVRGAPVIYPTLYVVPRLYTPPCTWCPGYIPHLACGGRVIYTHPVRGALLNVPTLYVVPLL